MENMTSDKPIVIVPPTPKDPVPAPRGFFDLTPEEMIHQAVRNANLIKDIIKKQKLSKMIQGREYVEVVGWTLAGALVGISAKETRVEELADKSYIGFVDLISVRTGAVVGGASSLCSAREKRWKSADDYARRSMAVTRATGKAYRISPVASIMALAGYETTPFEEMPLEPFPQHQDQNNSKAKTPPQAEPYDSKNTTHANRLKAGLEKRGIAEEHWADIEDAMEGKSPSILDTLLKERGLYATQ